MEDARTFTDRLAGLLARENAALGDFLVALAEFDRQRLWLDLGYPSLFEFLHRELGLSKASASFRKKAAELVQRFPETLEPLRDGRLCLSSVYELAKVLTPENREDVLPRFFQLSKRDAKAVAAALRPDLAPPHRDMVTEVRLPVAAAVAFAADAARAVAGAVPAPDRSSLSVVCPDKLPAVPPPDRASPGPAPGAGSDVRAAPAPLGIPPAPSGVGPAPMTVDPLTAELNRLHVTVSRRFLEKLDAARAALSHSRPGASASEILEAALDLLLERHARRRGIVKKPRQVPRKTSNPDHVPAHVKRAVWKRDGGKCQWPLASGGICGSTVQVELDHRSAKARGGPPTIENLRCLCRLHNDVAAREAFGDAWMDQFTTNPRAHPASPPP